MRIEDEMALENIKLRAQIVELKREIARLESELEAQQLRDLGLTNFTIPVNQLTLFELLMPHTGN
jgi:hypothetical protein